MRGIRYPAVLRNPLRGIKAGNTSDTHRGGSSPPGWSSSEMTANQPHELEKIPGIGPKRAQALRQAGFENVADLQDATEQDLVEVGMIDEILARDIKATVSPSRRHQRKGHPPNQITPEDWEVTDRQIAHLEELSGERLSELSGEAAIELVDHLEWRLDSELLGFKRVCGRVVKRDPTTGEVLPVPYATVHVQDTDCNFLGFFPPSSLWGWFLPFGCHREEIATVRTDACGRFCVLIPRWEIDRILTYRRERICLPEIVKPRIRDILENLEIYLEPPLIQEPPPRPDPAPFALREPGVYDQLRGLIGEETTNRLFALTAQPSFGDSTREVDTLLDQVAPTGTIAPPVPTDIPDLGDGQNQEILFHSTAIDRTELDDLTLEPRDFIGPFLRCRDVVIPEWTTIFDVPDITFEVTQDIDGDGTEETVYSEGYFDVRWDDIPDSDIVLEASELAETGLPCDPDVEPPDCEKPELWRVGGMPLAPGFHSNGPPREGYALRVNRPRPGSKVAATPYAGTLNLYGCGFRTEEAEYYRLLYKKRRKPDDPPTDAQAFDIHWPVYRRIKKWPPRKEHFRPDDEGWYEIRDPKVIAPRFQDLLLHWRTGKDEPKEDGLYDIRLELADGDKNPLDEGGESDWVTLRVDNSEPKVWFDELEWRTIDGGENGSLPLSCPVIERPLDEEGNPKTIEIDVSYTVQHRHLRNLSLGASGCGGGKPDKVDTNGDFGFWYSEPDDTHYSIDGATFRVEGGPEDEGRLPAGAYTIGLTAWSRAFEPTRRGIEGLRDDWNVDRRYVGNHERVRIAIVNKI